MAVSRFDERFVYTQSEGEREGVRESSASASGGDRGSRAAAAAVGVLRSR